MPFTLVAASPGGRAGLGVREHFSAIMERQPVRLFETHGIGSYGDKLDNGELIDADTVTELAESCAALRTSAAQTSVDAAVERSPIVAVAMIRTKDNPAICGMVTRSNASTHRALQGLSNSQKFDFSGNHWIHT